MLYNILSLTTAFKFINFAAFIGLGVYLFKRYLLPSLKKQLHEKKVLLQNLENQKQGIKYQLNNLDQAIEQQRYLAEELKRKIAIWTSSVHANNERALHEQATNQAKIDSNNELKNQRLIFEQMNKKLVPKIVAAVKRDLTHEFEQPELINKYMNDILRFIEKSS